MDICLEVLNMSSVVTQKSELFGDVLLQARIARGFTQDQLVLRCGNILSKSYLSQLENNKTRKKDGKPVRPDEAIVDALAEALGASKNEFRKLTDNMPIADESSRDDIADEFTFMLARYRQLPESSRSFIKTHLNNTIDFVIETEKIGQRPRPADKNPPDDIDSAKQTINIMPMEEIPEMDAEELTERQRLAKEKTRRSGK